MEPIIELKNISKTFESKQTKVHALKNITLKINKGDLHGIIGMSGAGKSTLIRTINYLCVPDWGEVFVHQENLKDLSESELLLKRQKIGMIFQHFNLLSQKTVLENVLLPLQISKTSKPETRKYAIELINLVGLADKINSYPQELSGGQKQRVAIARALVNKPDILLCDEATSALDPISIQSILNLLKDLHQTLNLTIVLITHEMSVITRICHRVTILDNGEIVEDGKVSEVFVNPQSESAKKLLFLQENQFHLKGNRVQLRLIFEGQKSDLPLLSQLILSTKQEINILWANTKEIEDKVYGQMMIEVSSDQKRYDEMIRFLNQSSIAYNIERGDN